MEALKITLAAARVNAGMTQEEAAEKLGIDRTTLFNYENGKTSPTMTMLTKMAEVYGISITGEYIFLPSAATKNCESEEPT